MIKLKKFFNNAAVKLTVRSLTAVIIIVGIVFAGVFGASAANRARDIKNIKRIEPAASAKNVVLMIGDGMGPNHLEVTKAYYGLDSLYMESLATTRGKVRTYSRNSDVTDSAAAATAMSTGVKVNNGQIAWHDGYGLENMTEYAAKCGKASGIVATETLTGATPAGFSAHNKARGNTDEIALSQLNSDVSLFMGAGASYYNGKEAQVEEHGFTYINDTATLNSGEYGDKVFVSYQSIAPYGEDASDTVGNLRDMSLFALTFLSESDEDGFFLMIEGSYIDKKSHSNDLAAMVQQLRAFDEAVKAVVEWANLNGETSVIVTADHETGSLKYDGESKDELSNGLFTSLGHSAADVYWFSYGVVIPQLTENLLIENVNISDICRALMKHDYDDAGGGAAAQCEIEDKNETHASVGFFTSENIVVTFPSNTLYLCGGNRRTNRA